MPRKKVKKQTHLGANGPSGKGTSSNAISRSPKSMVIRIGAGEVGPSVSQLVKDVRTMMQPDTAARLKERKANKLRDYLTMSGPLGVTHLMLFSRSESGNTNMRLAITPRGPTLHFQVEKYSLCKDIRKALKHPKGGGKEYLTAPLVRLSPLFKITC
jgi:ribosome biogenesis protein SSF1/2